MKTKQRYGFWKVFWIVLGFYTFFTLLGVLVLYIQPSEEVKNHHSIYTIWFAIQQVVSVIFATFFFYYTLNLYYRYLSERKSYVLFVRLSVIAALATIAYHVICFFVYPRQATPTVALVALGIAIATFFYIGLSLLIAYLTNLRDGQKQRKVLEEQKLQLEIEKSQANLNFLKAQINPHFLHNTLNFLYAKSLPYSPELSEGILTLSDIMRYALSEGNARDGKAPLQDEIEHVRNVIKINQLRFSNNLNVNFNVNGVVNGATIIPFVLITLVENAFKHGDLKRRENPIDIRLDIDTNKLVFFCSNRKKSGPKEISTGVGLDNIKKRLELAYGKNYSLQVRDDDEFYTTELSISPL